MPLKLGLIGYGEVGQLFAREWIRAGAEVAACDIKLASGAGEALRRVAAADGVRLCDVSADVAAGADYVISAVTADQAVAAASGLASALQAGQIYVDLNSVSPSTKRRVAQALGRVDFVEFAVMSPVAGMGLAAPILAGGERARETAERLNALGMRIDAVSFEIGVASATKLCRSIVIKGLEAIMVDFSLAAEKAGVADAVLRSLNASYPGMDWAEISRLMPTRVARHGVRRAAEMREAARMLEELELAGDFADANADRHEHYARERR